MEKNARIYVAGHTGLVGSAIVRKLRQEGYNNLILRTHKELELTDQRAVDDFYLEARPEYVFDAAALVGGIRANSASPADFFYKNMQIENNLIWGAHKANVKKLLFLGSACMYPKECEQPMKEEFLLTGLPEPTNEGYALAKVCGARLCSYLRRQYNDDFISAIPANTYGPRVTAVHPEDWQLAKKIEAMLLAQIRQRNFKEMNDEQERTVPIQGGDFWHVEWDPEGGFHCQMGDLSVELRHPKQVIPQPGVYDLEKMDYLFVLVSQSRRALEKRYGVRLPEEGESDVAARTSEEEGTVEGLVTQNIAYYRNSSGGVGCFSWVGDVTLEDMEDYQSRRQWVCAGCGATVDPPRGGKAARCPVCGAKSARSEPVRVQALPRGKIRVRPVPCIPV